MLKWIRNFRIAWNSPRWKWALLIAFISDILSFGFTLLPPLQWGLDITTVILMLIILGFKWPLFLALIVEAIPAIQVFPSWILVVLALAASEKNT